MANKRWLHYEKIITGKTFSKIKGDKRELSYWQDFLFFNFLFYCLPVCFILFISTAFLAMKDGYLLLLLVDTVRLVLVSIVIFVHKIPLKTRKFFIIAIFYIVSIFLIALLGNVGPGIFYLFALTILITLLYPKNYGYWPILINTLVLSFYAVNIHFNLFYSEINREYTIGKWIAFSSNLTFLSVVIVGSINRIFQHLQNTLNNQYNTEKELGLSIVKIKKSEANLKAIFTSSIDGFILLDEDFNIEAYNIKAKEYVLLNKKQLDFECGRNIFDYLEKSRLTYFRSAINKVYNGEIVEYDRNYRNDVGSILWIRYTLTPVYEDLSIKGVLITGRDVTVRKLYLQNVEDQNKTFREISWMQSHLVRAPLARLMGLIGLLKNHHDDDFEETINYVLLSAIELDKIINDITMKSNSIIDKYPASADMGKKKESRIKL